MIPIIHSSQGLTLLVRITFMNRFDFSFIFFMNFGCSWGYLIRPTSIILTFSLVARLST
jgi:hypothetical protein